MTAAAKCKHTLKSQSSSSIRIKVTVIKRPWAGGGSPKEQRPRADWQDRPFPDSASTTERRPPGSEARLSRRSRTEGRG
eukprot:4234881-Pyramimonas_sp.AAC.1